MIKQYFKYLLVLAFIFLMLPINSKTTLKAEEPAVKPLQVDNISGRQLDKRAQILNAYLQKYNSPLQYHVQDFIDAADENGVNWMLVPSIAGVESTFGKFIPGGHDIAYTSYNAWGWGVYGNQVKGFKSWRDGIFTVTSGLKKNYINKGLTDPYAMNKVYAASPVWGQKVSYFLNDLDLFTKKYETAQQPQKVSKVLTKTAGASAQLAYTN